MSIALRPMTRDDLPAIVGLEVAVFGREAWTREMLAGELAGVPGVRHYLVAEESAAAEQDVAAAAATAAAVTAGAAAAGAAGQAAAGQAAAGQAAGQAAAGQAAAGQAAAGHPEPAAVVGYAGLLVPGGGQADVLTLAVAEDHWGQGIGAALLSALLAEAARRDCQEVFLEVRVDNTRAQRLYRGYGFADVGLRRGYYQPSGTDALVMRRDLGDDGPGPGEPGATGADRPAVAGPATAGVAGPRAAAGGLPPGPAGAR